MKYGWAPLEEIHKRIGHITVAYRHQIVVWGGFMADRDTDDKFVASEQIWFYNTLTEVWSFAETSGDMPEGYTGSTGVVCHDYLYLFGGMVEESNHLFMYTNNLYRLNLKTLVWSKLDPSGPRPERCDKGVGWEYKNKIYFFGGYGERPQNQTEFAFYLDINNHSSKGWNNQFFCYDPVANSWSIPKTKGIPPNPRAAHAADISGERAFVSGGREGNTRKNDLFCINMETLTWSINLNLGKDPVPEGLSWHSFTFVTPNKAVLYGGLKHYGSPSLDWWECTIDDYNDVSWKQQPKLVNPLVWHKAAISKATGELIIVGGVCDSPYQMNEEDHVDKLVVLPYQPISLFRLCLNIIVKDKALQMMATHLPKPLMDLIVFRSNQTNNLTEI